MFFTVRFILVLIIWFLLADKKRWRELFPVGIFAALLGSLTDAAFIDYYKLWDYHEPHGGNTFVKEVLNDIGMYIVTTYLFFQWFPKEKTTRKMLIYWFVWTGFAIIVEWIHVLTGHMEHHKWWNMWWSYAFDWILLWVFYKFYTVFDFKRMLKGKV